jgi:hypothetical protein
VTDARLVELLRSLPAGQAMWLPAAGNSLWPFIRSGDLLRVERCGEGGVAPGDVALLEYPTTLVAHLVVGLAPVRTASSVGVVDPPALGVLGRVVAFQRAGVTVALPPWARPALGRLPAAARWAKGLPGARRLVRWLRDA